MAPPRPDSNKFGRIETPRSVDPFHMPAELADGLGVESLPRLKPIRPCCPAGGNETKKTNFVLVSPRPFPLRGTSAVKRVGFYGRRWVCQRNHMNFARFLSVFFTAGSSRFCHHSAQESSVLAMQQRRLRTFAAGSCRRHDRAGRWHILSPRRRTSAVACRGCR